VLLDHLKVTRLQTHNKGIFQQQAWWVEDAHRERRPGGQGETAADRTETVTARPCKRTKERTRERAERTRERADRTETVTARPCKRTKERTKELTKEQDREFPSERTNGKPRLAQGLLNRLLLIQRKCHIGAIISHLVTALTLGIFQQQGKSSM